MQTGLVQRAAALHGEAEAISREQCFTTNVSLAVNCLCLLTVIPLVAIYPDCLRGKPVWQAREVANATSERAQ